MELYQFGTIIKPHALKGEVKVTVDSSFDRLVVGNTVYLEDRTPLVIKSVRTQGNLFLVSFAGYPTIDDIQKLIGQALFVTHDESELQDGEYYYETIIGKLVIDQDGQTIGKVRDIIELPHGELLEVVNGKQRHLIPFVAEYVKEVRNDVIVIQVVEGVL